MKFSKIIVGLVLFLNTIFAGVVLYIFYRIRTEPVALIGAWFSFTTVELWALAGIKRKEVGTKHGNQKTLGKN